MTDPIVVPLTYKGHQVGIATVDGNTILCEIHPDKNEFAAGITEMLTYGLADGVSLGTATIPAAPTRPKKGLNDA